MMRSPMHSDAYYQYRSASTLGVSADFFDRMDRLHPARMHPPRPLRPRQSDAAIRYRRAKTMRDVYRVYMRQLAGR